MHALWELLLLSHFVYASLFVTDFQAPSLNAHYSSLKAAKRYRDILTRSDDFSIGHQVELAYAEHRMGEAAMSSHVRLEADQPTLLLEDFDHHLIKVECNGSKMTIALRSGETYKKAKEACTSLIGGLLISSHHTCGDEGAHTVYRVMKIVFDDEFLQLEFDLQESILEKEFRTVIIEFGHTDERYIIHRHDRLFRRSPQEPSIVPTQAGVGRPTGVDSTAIPTESFASQEEETRDVTDLGFESINTTFFDNSTILEELNPIRLGCANCTAKGDMIVTSAQFKLDFGAWFLGEDNDPVKSGFIQLEINGFEMSIGLKAFLNIPLKLDVDLLEITPIGFNIPKIGHFGITIALAYFLHIKVKEAVELGFGFDVNVPDSLARLDVAEMQQSTIRGFDETEVTLKPLSANVSNLEFSIVGGLKPKIVAGIKFLGLSFEGGPYVSLPKVNMTVTQMATDDVGADCTTGGDTDVKFKEAFQNLTHVDYTLGIAAGLGLELGLLDFGKDLWDKSLLNATQCLAYQTNGPATGLAVAQDVLSSITHPTPSSTSGKTSNGVRYIPEFRGEIWLAVFGIVPAIIAIVL